MLYFLIILRNNIVVDSPLDLIILIRPAKHLPLLHHGDIAIHFDIAAHSIHFDAASHSNVTIYSSASGGKIWMGVIFLSFTCKLRVHFCLGIVTTIMIMLLQL